MNKIDAKTNAFCKPDPAMNTPPVEEIAKARKHTRLRKAKRANSEDVGDGENKNKNAA